MNTEKINQYLTISRQVDQISDCALQDKLLGKLDDIWYSCTSEELDYIKNELNRNKHITQEKPIMNNVFENKEDYLSLRNFWKQYHAEGRHKAVPEEYKWYNSATNTVESAYHMVSPLYREAHLIYLAAMGKSLDKAIGNATSETIQILKNWLYFGTVSAFIVFEGSIDNKYYEPIIERIREYVKGR